MHRDHSLKYPSPNDISSSAGKIKSKDKAIQEQNPFGIGMQIVKGLVFKHKKLTDAQTRIKDILVNKLLFQQSTLDQTIFKSDLVIQMKVPNKNYIKRSQKMQLGSILRKVPQTLHHAYEAAYQELYHSMQQQGDEVPKQKQANNTAQNEKKSDDSSDKLNDEYDRQLLIRNFSSFVPINKSTRELYYQQQQQQIKIKQDEEYGASIAKQKRVQYNAEEHEQINLNCFQEYTGVVDAFIISYNALIYCLQQVCGFKVKSFMITDNSEDKDMREIKKLNTQSLEYIYKMNKGIHRTIYILLHLPDENAIKAANKYRIKKQIDYAQVDPFLNDPMDKAHRPIRYNSSMQQHLIALKNKRVERNTNKIVKFILRKSKSNNDDKPKAGSFKQQDGDEKYNDTQSSKLEQTEDEFTKLRKTIDRKIGFHLPDNGKNSQILHEVKMAQRQANNYVNFVRELQQRLYQLIGSQYDHNCFNDPNDHDYVTQEQKDYLNRINRYKYNPGVQKKFVQVKKQRKYYSILKQLFHKYGYQTYQLPLIYSDFKLANKKKKFFSRLQQVLLYKQSVVSPYGELELFNKMQRTKLTYSILKQHIRVQNLYMINSTLFALSDDYQKFGKIGQKVSSKFYYQYLQQGREKNRQIKGGLNGRNLQDDWHKLYIWKTNVNTIRNYLGESKTFQVFIKTFMIQLFIFLTPFGIATEIIKFFIISPNSSQVAYFPEFWFYIIYMFIVTVVYGVYIEKYRQAQFNYIHNFVQENQTIEFLNEYRGPYLRDTSGDNANTYDEKFVIWRDKIFTYIIFLLFFLVVCGEIGFYYGMRAAIVAFSYQIPEYDTSRFYMLRPIQLIGYSIFFVSNAVVYRYGIIPLANFLTKFQNRPTKQAFINSQNLKLYIFCIGLQMIGPIDLVFIQYAAKTSCSADWCAKQLQAYVYCRYFIILAFALLSTADMVRRYLKDKQVQLFQNHEKVQFNYSGRLKLFLQFVYRQSKKDPSSDIKLVDETVALVQFATFLTIFPLAPAISFISMMIDYNVQRLEILQNEQRPIPKSDKFQVYRKIVVAIGHWMLFFNFSRMFITLEWLEYLFPHVVLSILGVPTPYTLMTLKYSAVLLFMIMYEVIFLLARTVVKRTLNVIDKRKWNMFQKYGVKNLSSGSGIVLKQPKPMHSLSRTFNLKQKNIEQQNSQQQNKQMDMDTHVEFNRNMASINNKSGSKISRSPIKQQ